MSTPLGLMAATPSEAGGVRVLLDTHTFIWFALDDHRLSSRARQVLSDRGFQKLVSVATLWEIAIKLGLRKLRLEMPFHQLVSEGIQGSGFDLLPITPRYAERIIELPLLHRDPFDRMLVAQALCEGCAILGCDAELDAYGVTRLW